VFLFPSPNFSLWGYHYVSVILASHFDSTPPSPTRFRGCSNHPDFKTRRGHFVFNYVESTSLSLPSAPHFIFVFFCLNLTFPRLIMLMIPNSITAAFFSPPLRPHQSLLLTFAHTSLDHFFTSSLKNIILNLQVSECHDISSVASPVQKNMSV
jgi:hypothetical protein